MDFIKVSIIVPIYNVEEYLERCLLSIINQTLEEIEVILVDDGSSDASGIIADRFVAQNGKVYVIHKENGGVTSARLTGMQYAKGQYIGFVDGDDVIEPDMYERLYNNAIKYKADIAHCGYQMVFPNRVDYYYNTGKITEQSKESGIKDLLTGEFVEPGLWNKIFSREICKTFLKDVFIDTSIRINEDVLMNYYLFKLSNKSIYEDFCPYHYMVQGNSAVNTNKKEHHLKDPLKVTEIIWDDVKTNKRLADVMLQRRAKQFISYATLSAKDSADYIKKYKSIGRRQIRSIAKDILLNKKCSLKLKLMVTLTSVAPDLYQFIHFIYAKLKGLDKKYSID